MYAKNQLESVENTGTCWIYLCWICQVHTGFGLSISAPMSVHWRMFSWWRHQMETFSALLALCAGNSPVTRSLDIFFDLRLNKRLSKQSRRWWFETTSRSLLRTEMFHCFCFCFYIHIAYPIGYINKLFYLFSCIIFIYYLFSCLKSGFICLSILVLRFPIGVYLSDSNNPMSPVQHRSMLPKVILYDFYINIFLGLSFE